MAKRILDLLMMIMLLCLMAYQVTGDELHEWIGVTALIVFILHNVMNIKWYFTLFKGKYTILRIIKTVVNLGIMVCILCLGFSGIVMSRHVFAAFPINGPMATARIMHLAASYWGFVLMSIHLGLHWSMVIGIIKSKVKNKNFNFLFWWLCRLLAVIIVCYGLYSFIKANIISYMFLENQFIFFNFEQPIYSVFAEYAAMMGFLVFSAYYIAKIIELFKKNKVKQK